MVGWPGVRVDGAAGRMGRPGGWGGRADGAAGRFGGGRPGGRAGGRAGLSGGSHRRPPARSIGGRRWRSEVVVCVTAWPFFLWSVSRHYHPPPLSLSRVVVSLVFDSDFGFGLGLAICEKKTPPTPLLPGFRWSESSRYFQYLIGPQVVPSLFSF